MVAAVAGGAVSMTLMACYGMSCVNDTCTEPDASGDAGDGGAEASGNDASLDASSDAASDASSDAPADASSDAPADAATD